MTTEAAAQEAQREVNRDRMRAWRAANPERDLANRKRYCEANCEKIAAAAKAWALANPDKVRAKARRYAKKNPEKIAFNMRKWREKPENAAAHRLRARLHSVFKSQSSKKNSTTTALLGCSFLKLRSHLEAQFLPGMSWQNRGEWHIDHIVPYSLALGTKELEVLTHYTNLRPLWGKENMAKHAKLPEESELPADLHDEVRKIWERARNSSC